MTPNSLFSRLVLLGVIFGGSLVLALLIGAYSALVHQLDKRAADQLRGKATQLQHVLSDWKGPSDLKLNEHRISDLLIGHEELQVAIAHAVDGKPIVLSAPSAQETLEQARNGGAGSGPFEWRSKS